MNKRNRNILIILFIVSLSIRLFLAFSTPNFTYDSYYDLRQVEHITQTGTPFFEDPYSYGGRELIILPLYHYLTAIFAFFIPLGIAAKLLNNVFFTSLGLVVFLIAQKVSKKQRAALFSAGIAFFLPITFQTHSFSPLPFALFCLLFCIYYFICARNEQHSKERIYAYTASLIFLTLSSSIASILIITILFYALFSLLEGQKVLQGEKEIILFSLFFFLWIQFLLFKNVFLKEGISFIWKNIPQSILIDYFPALNIQEALFLIGFVPLIAGIFFVYSQLLQEKNKNIFLMVSIVIASFALTALKLIQFNIAIAFTGLALAIIFAPFYDVLVNYYKKSKFMLFEENVNKKTKILLRNKRFVRISTIIIIVLLIPSMVIPSLTFSLQQEIPSQEKVDLFTWIQDNTPKSSVIAASVQEGHLISYFSKRKNVIDPQFSLIKDVEARYKNINSIYTTQFQTQAIDITDIYNINYIVLTNSSRKKFEIEQLSYRTSNCFDLVYNDEKNNKVYSVGCTLNTQ
jgi:hypothetical protein